MPLGSASTGGSTNAALVITGSGFTGGVHGWSMQIDVWKWKVTRSKVPMSWTSTPLSSAGPGSAAPADEAPARSDNDARTTATAT